MERRDDIRAFASRRWDLVEESKLLARADRFRREGAEGCVRAADALRETAHALGVHGDRAADLRAHVAWRLLLDRAHARGQRAR